MMAHHMNLTPHCKGYKPVLEKHSHWWRVTCPKCGKRIAYLRSDKDAKTNWNAMMECAQRYEEISDEK